MGRKIVYHMEGWTPDQLIVFQEHHNRSGGDLEHCDKERKSQNEQIHGTETWAEDFVAEVAFLAELNMRHEAVRLDERGRLKEAKQVRAAGPQDPWKASSKLGVVRAVVVSADETFFRQKGFEEFEGADFRDPKVCEEFKTRAVAFMDAKIDRKYCLAMFWEMDEKVPHLHAYYARWKVKDTKTRGRQRLLQPTDMIHFRNAEKAQTEIAEWFADMGLERGDDTAQQRRDAKAKGEVPPEKKRHTPPWLYRRQQREEFLNAAEKARAEQAKAAGRKRAAEVAETQAKAEKAAAIEAKKTAEEARQSAEDAACKERARLDLEAQKRRRLEDKTREDRIRREDEDRARKIALEEKKRKKAEADCAKKLDAREAELDKKAADLTLRERAIREAVASLHKLSDMIRPTAEKLGLLKDPVIELGLRAHERIRRMVGSRGGD